MSPIPIFCFMAAFILSNRCRSSLLDTKVFMVLMEDDPVVSYKTSPTHVRNDEDVKLYKESVVTGHDTFLESRLPDGSYTKLYSYTHLLNGFAVHVKSEEALEVLRQGGNGVKIVQEDTKMRKMTTHTPDFLGLPAGVWPHLGGAEFSGNGVVIGMIDTGIDPLHPSFRSPQLLSNEQGTKLASSPTKFRGKCQTGRGFPPSSCQGKIAGARYFARAAIAAGEFNATRDHASPFDADGHGSHTASTAAGNHRIPVRVNGYNYGYASGMAPGARIAVYKALYSFGGYMSDVVAAIDQAVEDGVDILSLSFGPSSVPQGAASFLNVLEIELLFATRAGVVVVQAVGNGGPSLGSVLSFSPWITSVAASGTDRTYNNTIEFGDGRRIPGFGLSPPSGGHGVLYTPVAAAVDVRRDNASSFAVEGCQVPEAFTASAAKGKLIICRAAIDFPNNPASLAAVVDTVQRIGAAGFIVTVDPIEESEEAVGTIMTFPIPGIVLRDLQLSKDLWEYYNSNTIHRGDGTVEIFGATARISDGREAIYTGKPPAVASYSSRGPDVNNAFLQTADVLKPSIMAPGSSIWAAWSSYSEGDPALKGQAFALLSGTSMATPHIAGVAALIKQKHPSWSPAAITSAMMTTASATDLRGNPILAQTSTNQLAAATSFDYGAGFVNPARAMDPGLVFDAQFAHYIGFLCSVPGVDDASVRRATGVGCGEYSGLQSPWCSDLNAASVTVSGLIGSRTVVRRVTHVGGEIETYRVVVREPAGVSVRVVPGVFTVSPNETRSVRIVLKANEASNGYTFGEMVMEGDRNHLVRIPITVSVTSVIPP
ncbi:hypothetical protein H6P81_005431 [Aristolochia fimbriata]|uniref:Subtilisin-like protease SBT2.5 n=1 Tax=Aristolochia fimbriata TaxID=158543 RepID=A0AAV7EUJ9_ARIFI|nr:hypothetical protein H6P81_005431 [Aristolochia fimbriata]